MIWQSIGLSLGLIGLIAILIILPAFLFDVFLAMADRTISIQLFNIFF